MTDRRPPRRRGLSVRWKLTLSYAGFLVLAGAALFCVLLLVLRYLPDENLTIAGTGGFAPNRSDLMEVALPVSAASLAFLSVVGLVGGWILSGQVLKPLEHIMTAAGRAAGGSLDHRIALPGPDDEFRRLADLFDTMLERLERTFDEQRRFTANASHELRTPHAVVKTLLEVARTDREHRDVDLLLARLDETNERSIATVESLLQLARLGHDDPVMEPVEVADVADEAVAVLELLQPGAVQLTKALEPVRVHGNRTLLVQLVGNLLRNAAQHHGGDRCQIWVRTGHDELGRPTLTVENSGSPLDPAVVARLTEPFVRGAARTSRSGRPTGSGLGLTLVASIARAHEADLVLRPRDGGGLRAVVRFRATADS